MPEDWPGHIIPENVKDDTHREIIRKAAAHPDWTQTRIAQDVGATKWKVNQILKEHLPTHPSRQSNQGPPIPPEEIDKVRHRLVNGSSSTDIIGPEYGVGPSTISELVKGERTYHIDTTTTPITYNQSDGWTFVDDDDEPENDDSAEPRPVPRSKTPPDALNLNDFSRGPERDIMTTAVEHPDWTQKQIAKHVGCGTMQVSETLRVYWPTHPSLVPSGRSEPITSADMSDIRRRLLSGESLADVANDYRIDKGALGKLAKGEYSVGDDADVPPIVYRNPTGWEVADNSHTAPEESEEQQRSR